MVSFLIEESLEGVVGVGRWKDVPILKTHKSVGNAVTYRTYITTEAPFFIFFSITKKRPQKRENGVFLDLISSSFPCDNLSEQAPNQVLCFSFWKICESGNGTLY